MTANNGLLIKELNNDFVYLIDEQKTRYVEGIDTFQGVFKKNAKINSVLDVSDLPTGQWIKKGTVLVKSDENEKVYLVDNYTGDLWVKRLIASWRVFENYQFNGEYIFTVPEKVIEAIPDGPQIGKE